MELKINQLDELTHVAKQLLATHSNKKIFLFNGEMGAGKTTLVKALCAELGSEDTVKSPTFGIVNEYDSPSGAIYHFDFYRIKKIGEAFDLGYEDYLYSGNF